MGLDKEALEQLLKTQYSGLLALLRRKIQDPHFAADLLNEALITSITHLKDGRIADPNALAGYAFRVALNLYRNQRRKHAERPEKRASPEVLDNAPEGKRPPDADELALARQVQALLSAMPAQRDRVLLERFYLEQEDKDVICRDLGLSPLLFDKVIFRARKRMRALLESHGFRKSDFLSLAALALA